MVSIFEIEGEVSNGGFDQYFFNSAGDHAFYGVTVFKAIGANAMADIFSQALSAFGPDGPPEDRFKRQDKLDEIRDSAEGNWHTLSKAFYKCPDDIAALVEKYLKAWIGKRV